MRIWQRAMMALARSPRATRCMQAARWARPLARRFVGGGDIPEAVAAALALRRLGRDVSLFSLGEYVETAEGAAGHVTTLQSLVPALTKAGLRPHVSVDPTQVGAMQSWEICRRHVFALAATLAEGLAAREDQAGVPGDTLMLDMEDATVTAATLALHHALRDAGLPAAVTVQAYLHRTAADLEALIARGAFVRLVKGAFAEPASLAATTRRDRDARYRAAVDRLFSPASRANGVYPALGTHDHRMIDHARRAAAAHGWPREAWEVEMLHGVRPAYQRRLAAEGVRVRVYLPFGRDWWPYSIRRVGETPRNLWFATRAALG